MSEFESWWRDFALTKLDAALDCFKCSDERSRYEAMCCYCGKVLDQTTALFASMNGKPPATSEQISTEAGLNERHVREWLAW